MKEADDAPAGTETLAGTVTAVLLLARATLMLPEGAAALRDTVQEVLPVPVNVVVPHVRALTAGVAEVPVPLRPTVAVGALLEIVNCPVADVAVVGLN